MTGPGRWRHLEVKCIRNRNHPSCRLTAFECFFLETREDRCPDANTSMRFRRSGREPARAANSPLCERHDPYPTDPWEPYCASSVPASTTILILLRLS